MKTFAMVKRGKWLVGVKVMVVLLFVSVATVSAAATELLPIACPTGLGSCVATDLPTSVSAAVPVGGDTCIDSADTIQIDLSVNWSPNSTSRYDLGLYIYTSGGPDIAGSTCVGSIAPIGAGEGGGLFVFKDLDGGDQPGDVCGDVNSAYPVDWAVRATVPCTPDASNNLVVNACRVWYQNTGGTCTSANPGTGAKCNCTPLTVTQVPVPDSATVTVVKHVVPPASGTFNLWVDEGNDTTKDHTASSVGDGGTLGPVTVPAGPTPTWSNTHRVGEDDPVAGTLTSITCVRVVADAIAEKVGPVDATSTLLTVEKDENWTCHIFNGTPDAVDLLSFTATGGRTTTLNWETASEVDNLGFNVYSAGRIDGPRSKLNDVLIPSQVAPGSAFGAGYTFTDLDLKLRGTYYYWLEDVDIYGNTGLHGPVKVTVSSGPRP